jgi:Cytochrome P460
MRLLPLLIVGLASAALACGQDDDPEGARVLWERVNAGPGFRTWARAPGFATRRPSFTAHADAVEIFVSPEVATTLSTKLVREWPVGSVIVKEGYRGDDRRLVAIMEKRADGWFWAEYDDGGTAKFSGRPSVCIDCHDNRKSYSDWVYSFELPR